MPYDERPGYEPSLAEVMRDPIFRHLRRFDGLPAEWMPELPPAAELPARRAA